MPLIQQESLAHVTVKPERSEWRVWSVFPGFVSDAVSTSRCEKGSVHALSPPAPWLTAGAGAHLVPVLVPGQGAHLVPRLIPREGAQLVPLLFPREGAHLIPLLIPWKGPPVLEGLWGSASGCGGEQARTGGAEVQLGLQLWWAGGNLLQSPAWQLALHPECNIFNALYNPKKKVGRVLYLCHSTELQ